VAELARALDLELAQPDDVNHFVPVLGLDAVVVCAYGALLKEPLLSEPGLLNVHPSLLPRWRGAAPIERAIMAGDPETGVAIMRPTAGFDEGPVCAVQREPIRPDDDFATLSARLTGIAAELLVRVFAEHPAFVEQAAEGVVYAEKIGPDDRTLDPSRPAVELDRVVRALHPHIGARLADGLGVRRARPLPDVRAPAGLSRDGDRLLLGTSAGALELLEVQPPGGRPMDAAAYLRGRVVP
jgi:methionyl-tRNA formyltransferase